MSDQPAPPTAHPEWDKPFTDGSAQVRAALDAFKQVTPDSPALRAGYEGLDAMDAEYVNKVVVQLRPERDALKAALRNNEKPVTPSEPTRPTSRKRLFTARAFDPGSLSPEMRELYVLSKADIKRQLNGPMARAAKFQTPYSSDAPYLQSYDVRWIGHDLFAAICHAKAFGETDDLKAFAQVILSVIRQMPTQNGPNCKSAKMQSIEQKGVRRMFRAAKDKDYDDSDWSGLEEGIHKGVFAMAWYVFNDLGDVDPLFKTAADELKALLVEMWGRLATLTKAFKPGKPAYFWGHIVAHSLIYQALFCKAVYGITGDKEALDGYIYFTGLINNSTVYFKTRAGLELASVPHAPRQRRTDMGEKVTDPAHILGAHEDFTYTETFLEAAQFLCWLGDATMTPRFLAAIGNLVMLATTPEGFGGANVASGLSGYGPEQAGKETAKLVSGEVVSTAGLRFYDPAAKQPAVVIRRGPGLSACMWTGNKAFIKDLKTAAGASDRKAPATWALMQLAAEANYPILERLA